MKKRKQQKSLQTGQTLIEILLAFSVAILVLSAVVVGVSTSLSNTQYSKNQNLANSYVQEGMAVVRQIRDSSWLNFTQYDEVDYCLDQNSTELTPASSPPLTCPPEETNVEIFLREVRLDHVSADCSDNSKATVTVSWADSKCPSGNIRCHKVNLVSCFFNLDKREEP